MRDPSYPPSRRGGLRRIDFRRMIVHDFPLKMAALAIAVIAFVAVVESTQEVTATFHVPIERPPIPAGYVLRGALGDATVLLRGPQPQVAKIGPADVHPTLDLATADLDQGELQNVAVHVVLSDAAVIAVIDPVTVPVRLEKLVTRSLAVQVRFANDPPKGFQPGTPSVSASEVRISGAQSLVASVAGVFATLRFGDSPIDISTSAGAVPADAAGNMVEGVTVDPPTVQVSVPVVSTTSTRTVPVLWSLRGSVAPGYWISRVTTDPAAVQLQGAQDRLAAIDRIDTAPVDVTNLTATRSFRVPLLLPDGVALLQPTDASVGVTVVPLTGTRPYPLVAVQVTGLGPGLTAETDPSTVSVVVAGLVSTLAGLGPDAVTAVVDASGKGPGASQVDVVLRLPAGVTVTSLQPLRVTLTMRNK